MKKSVRGIVIKDKNILLIKRIKKERTYYVIPGGGLEKNETLEEGVIREVKEELGITVSVGNLIGTDDFQNTRHYFFDCTYQSGILGTGTGPEYTDPNYEGEGQYIPIAIPLAKLEEIELIPSVIKSLIIDKYLNEKHSK